MPSLSSYLSSSGSALCDSTSFMRPCHMFGEFATKRKFRLAFIQTLQWRQEHHERAQSPYAKPLTSLPSSPKQAMPMKQTTLWAAMAMVAWLSLPASAQFTLNQATRTGSGNPQCGVSPSGKCFFSTPPRTSYSNSERCACVRMDEAAPHLGAASSILPGIIHKLPIALAWVGVDVGSMD
jgi:hypothetical protein